MPKFTLKRFLISRMIAALGDQFMMFAVPLVILKTTGSVKWSGLAFAIEWLPRLFFLPISGSLADRINVRKLYRMADLSRAFLVLFAFLAVQFFPQNSFWILSLVMAFMSILNSLAFIGMEATLPRQLPPEEMPKAQSWLQGVDQISQIMGPAIAGALATFFDLKYILCFGSSFFIISFLNSFSLPVSEMPEVSKKSFFHIAHDSYRKGFSVLFERRLLLQLCALTWIVNLIYGTALVVAPAIVTQTFLGSQGDYGMLQTAAGIVCIVSFLLAPKMVRKFGLHGVGLFAFIGMVLGACISSFSSNIFSFGLGLGLLLGADGLFNVFVRSLRAKVIPKEDFGKVTGVIILVNNFSLPLSGFAVSILSGNMTSQQMLFWMTGTALILGVLVIALGKVMFKYRTLMPSLEQ